MHPDNVGQQFKVRMMPMSVVGKAYSEYGVDAKDLRPEDLATTDRDGRSYNFSALVTSVAKHGVKDPIHVAYDHEEKEYHLLDGNHRFLAAKQLGHTHIPVHLDTLYSDGKLPKEYS